VTLKARVIPCLDVKDGRVVKGVNFVDLIDAGVLTSFASWTSQRRRTIATRSSTSSPAPQNNASCR
jgi:hypothetical protein